MLRESLPAVAATPEMCAVMEIRAGQETKIAQQIHALEIGDRQLRSRQTPLRRAKIELRDV